MASAFISDDTKSTPRIEHSTIARDTRLLTMIPTSEAVVLATADCSDERVGLRFLTYHKKADEGLLPAQH